MNDSPDPFPALNDLLDGRLTPPDAEALRARIEAEPALREQWEELCRVRDWARDHSAWTESVEVPPDFAAAVRARTTAAAAETAQEAGGATPGRPPAGRLLRMLTVAYAAAALLVVGLTVRWALDDRGAPLAEKSTDTTTTAWESGIEKERDKERQKERDKAVKDELVRLEARDAPDAPAPEAPVPDVSGGRAAAEGGGFRPGGAVRPGLREPKDAADPPAPSPVARLGTGKSSGPVDRLREGLADARRAGERVYVIEADDPDVGVREARRLLASLGISPKMAEKKAPARVAEAETSELDGASDADEEEAAAPVWRLYALAGDTPGNEVPRNYELVTSIGETLSADSHRQLAALAAEAPSGKAKKRGRFKQPAKGAAPAAAGAGGGGSGASAPSAPSAPAAPATPRGGAKAAAPAVRVRILILKRR